MKKIVGTVSLAALAVLLASGCSGAPNAEAPASTTAAAASSIPKPDGAQTASLRAEIAKINPLLDNEKSVGNARNQCTSIPGGGPYDKLINAASTRFTGGRVKEVSDHEAPRIIDVIKANGFCKA